MRALHGTKCHVNHNIPNYDALVKSFASNVSSHHKLLLYEDTIIIIIVYTGGIFNLSLSRGFWEHKRFIGKGTQARVPAH